MARRKLPETGELVVATVREVYDYGAYLNLDEYGGLEAYLPWSEVASRWVRSIHDVVRPGQKIVVKVIRINKRRGQVDVSLKRVTEGERRRKMAAWKRAQKAEKILEIIAGRLGKSLEDAYREVGWKLEEAYGELMAAFEEIAIRGASAVKGLGIGEEWVEPLIEEVKRHVEVRQVRIGGVLTVRSRAGDGIERVKKTLIAIRDAILSRSSDVKVRVYTIGAPRYRIELEGFDYKVLEKALEEGLSHGIEVARELGVELSFTREKTAS